MKPTILVPFDFSEQAEAALSWAADLRAATGAPPVKLVHAIDIRPLVTVDLPAQVPTDDEVRELEQTLRGLAARRDIPVEARVVVGSSPIGEMIVEVAKEPRVDLIVMGTHGKTGLQRLLMGSVAEHVVRHADCPVLVVRGRAIAQPVHR